MLIGGAGAGSGVRRPAGQDRGARVIGTGSAESADHLRGLGAEPVVYGDGLADRVRALAPDGITAAVDLHGTETVHVARELGVPDSRICTIAAQVDGVTAANGATAPPGALEEIAGLVADGTLRVPLAAASRSRTSAGRRNSRRTAMCEEDRHRSLDGSPPHQAGGTSSRSATPSASAPRATDGADPRNRRGPPSPRRERPRGPEPGRGACGGCGPGSSGRSRRR